MLCGFHVKNKNQNKNYNKLVKKIRDFPSGPVVKNPPCNSGDMGSIPGRGTGIPRATEQLNKSMCHN